MIPSNTSLMVLAHLFRWGDSRFEKARSVLASQLLVRNPETADSITVLSCVRTARSPGAIGAPFVTDVKQRFIKL